MTARYGIGWVFGVVFGLMSIIHLTEGECGSCECADTRDPCIRKVCISFYSCLSHLFTILSIVGSIFIYCDMFVPIRTIIYTQNTIIMHGKKESKKESTKE